MLSRKRRVESVSKALVEYFLLMIVLSMRMLHVIKKTERAKYWNQLAAKVSFCMGIAVKQFLRTTVVKIRTALKKNRKHLQ